MPPCRHCCPLCKHSQLILCMLVPAVTTVERQCHLHSRACCCLVSGSKKIKVEGRRHRDRHQKERKRMQGRCWDRSGLLMETCMFFSVLLSPSPGRFFFPLDFAFVPCQGLVTISSSPSRGSFRMPCFAPLLPLEAGAAVASLLHE